MMWVGAYLFAEITLRAEHAAGVEGIRAELAAVAAVWVWFLYGAALHLAASLSRSG